MHTNQGLKRQDKEYPGLDIKGESNEMPIPKCAARGMYTWAWWVLHS